MKRFILLLCLVPLFAPMPWGIALNHLTKECAGFWGGDEYGSFDLPEGWDVYYPDANDIIHTEIGSWIFLTSKQYEAAESCRDELPNTYVSPNIGNARTSPLLVLFTGFVGIVLLVIIVVAIAVIALRIGVVLVIWKMRY